MVDIKLEELRKIVFEEFPNENNYSRVLHIDKNLRDWVDQQLPHISDRNEKIFLLLNYPNKVCNYGNSVKFLDYKRGYGYCNKAESCKCLSEVCGTTSKPLNDEAKEQRTIDIKSTKKKRYGDENYNNRDKSEKTLKSNYNVTNPMWSEEIKQTLKDTNTEKYGVDNPAKVPEFIDKGLETKYLNGSAIPPELKDPFEYYSYKIRLLSETIYRDYKDKINPHNIQRGRTTHHLDHRFSIKDGFLNNVSIDMISHWRNLEIIPQSENQQKSGKSSISLDELFILIDSDK